MSVTVSLLGLAYIICEGHTVVGAKGTSVSGALPMCCRNKLMLVIRKRKTTIKRKITHHCLHTRHTKGIPQTLGLDHVLHPDHNICSDISVELSRLELGFTHTHSLASVFPISGSSPSSLSACHLSSTSDSSLSGSDTSLPLVLASENESAASSSW